MSQKKEPATAEKEEEKQIKAAEQKDRQKKEEKIHAKQTGKTKEKENRENSKKENSKRRARPVTMPKEKEVNRQSNRQRGKKGIIHIYASHNNTIILLTDVTRAETIAKCSGGQVVKAQHKEGSPYAAMKIAEIVAEKAKEKGVFEVDVLVRGPGGNKPLSPGSGAESAIRSLTRNGMRIRTIENVTPVPHNGCRKKKRHRGKRGK